MCKELLTSKFLNHSFKKDDIAFTFTKVSKISGEAQINIRKGKQIIVYDYEIECDWLGVSTSDECEGTFKIVEINESDFDFEIISLGVTKEGKIGSKAKAILRKCLKDEVISLVKNITTELMNFENDAKKLEEDKQKRMENDEKYKQILQEKGSEKDKLLEIQKEEDEKKKQK